MNPGGFLSTALVVWFGALVALLVYKTATGQIDLSGLLQDDDGNFSPERGQLLIASLATMANYAAVSLHPDENGKMQLADPSLLVLSGIGGSQVIYLIGKYARELISRNKTAGG